MGESAGATAAWRTHRKWPGVKKQQHVQRRGRASCPCHIRSHSAVPVCPLFSAPCGSKTAPHVHAYRCHERSVCARRWTALHSCAQAGACCCWCEWGTQTACRSTRGGARTDRSRSPHSRRSSDRSQSPRVCADSDDSGSVDDGAKTPIIHATRGRDDARK
jgi:hypothetical protein